MVHHINGGGKVSDSQRQKVYNAERIALREIATPFKTEKEIRQYVSRIVKSKWFAKRYPITAANGVRVIFDWRLTKSARGDTAIRLPARDGWAWYDSIVLHELAHCCARGGGHAGDFARAFLVLVDKYMGDVAGRSLRHEFNIRNVTRIDDRAHFESTAAAARMAKREGSCTWRVENGRWIKCIEINKW